MTRRDRLLPVANRARRLRQRFGLTTIGVTTRVENWSAAIGTPGAVVSSVVDVFLDPQPKTRKASDSEAAFLMAAYPAVLGGLGVNDIYAIGPITPLLSLAVLVGGATATPSRRILVMLSGDSDLGAAPGSPFLHLPADTSRPFRQSLFVYRTQTAAELLVV